MAEAISALVLASNLHDSERLHDAYAAVGAVRHAKDVEPFDICRADLIFSATISDRDLAIQHAENLADESRRAGDVERACIGLRNAAEALMAFGAHERSQSLLLEARGRAQELEYHAQMAMCDLRLSDLAIHALDHKGASKYIESAERLIEANSIKSPYLAYDLNFFRCWHSIAEADLASGQRACRALVRIYKSSAQGTTKIATVSTKLATFCGRPTAATEREFRSLMSVITASRCNFNQELSMFGALEYSKRSGCFAETVETIQQQIPRLLAMKGAIWEPLASSLAGTWRWRD